MSQVQNRADSKHKLESKIAGLIKVVMRKLPHCDGLIFLRIGSSIEARLQSQTNARTVASSLCMERNITYSAHFLGIKGPFKNESRSGLVKQLKASESRPSRTGYGAQGKNAIPRPGFRGWLALPPGMLAQLQKQQALPVGSSVQLLRSSG